MDFPDPDTPVTLTKHPKGIDTSTFCKLFPDAPFKLRNLPVPFLLCVGIDIFFLFDKNCPVIELLFLMILDNNT